MQRKLLIKIFVSINIFWGVILFPLFSCYAQEPAKLKILNLQKAERGIQILLEHSKAPVNFDIVTSEKPPHMEINIQGARVTFKTYENVPIEIPVNERGVKRIVVEERTDFRQSPPELVRISIEMTQMFEYEVDSQWGDQFVVLTINPTGAVEETPQWTKVVSDTGPSEKIEKIKKIKDLEATRAKERLENFTKDSRRENLKKESAEKLSKVRKEAKERVEKGETLEKAYEKLKADTGISTIPLAREQLMDPNMYKDVSLPSEIQPVIRRAVSATDIQTLEDCLGIAIAANLPVQIAQEQQKLSKLRVREARRSFYPAFLGQWKEIDGKTITEPYRGRSIGVQAQQPLFTGGKLTAALRKEQLGELIARGNLDRLKQDLIFNVSKTYYELVAAKRTYDLLNAVKIKEAELLTQIEKEFQILSATPAELLTAQSLFNQVCFQVASTEREFILAKLKLEKEMFTENINIDNMSFQLRNRNIEVTLEECLDLAFRNRPELNILERTIKATKYGEDVIRSEEFPNVSLIGSYGRSGEAFDQRNLQLATEWSLVGQVKWFLGGNTVESSYTRDQVTPYKVTKSDTNLRSQTMDTKFSFWDNLAHFSKRKEAQITRKQAEKDLAEMRNKIQQETEDAYYSFIRFKTQLGFSLNEIGFRRKQLEIAKAKKRMNESSTAEVMEAEFQLIQANANYEQALAAINGTIGSLNRAIGIIGYFK
ncbi:MAG: TolC family protein [Candidatus Omnitrophota bacterium]